MVVLSFYVVLPFLKAILAGMILSYVFYPVYTKINKKLNRKNLSSLIVSVLVILVITLPFFFIINAVSKEAYTTYIITRQKVSSGSLISTDCGQAANPICKFVDYAEAKFNDPQIRYQIDNSIKKASTYVIDGASNFVLSVPAFFLKFFIIIFVMFFFFRDGQLMVGKIEKLLPLKKTHQKYVFKKFKGVMSAVIYGNLIVAVIQGALGGIGFFIFGVPSPILWGIVMMFFSLIPYLGSSIVWFPAALMLLFNGYVQLDNTIMVKGILLIVWGIFIVGLADNFLKPKIIGNKANIHPVLVLLGVLGGLAAFGVIGLIIGPIILALLTTFIKIYEEEK
jgi:predicted PurR-regulated permease PerM